MRIAKGYWRTRFARRKAMALGNKMKLNILVPFFFLVLALSGCAPNAVTYYRPAAEGGQVRAQHCVPVESLLDLEIKNAKKSVKIRAWADDGKYINQVYLGFSGGLWSNIKFTSTDFKVIDLDKNITIDSVSVFADKHDGFSKLNTEPYTAPDVRAGLQVPRFSVQVRLPDPMPKNFELSIPSILIDGDEIELPTIRFERKVWVGISPFNC